MPPTIISSKASNWVDRGEPARFTLTRVLSRFLNQNPADRRDWFDEQAEIIQAMVAADATEVHLAGYLRTLLPETEGPARESAAIRLTAIALWHIAKAALVRLRGACAARRSPGERADAGQAVALARDSPAIGGGARTLRG